MRYLANVLEQGIPSMGILLNYMAKVSNVTFQNLNKRSGNFIFVYGFVVTEKTLCKIYSFGNHRGNTQTFFKS
jgi:hypothetical protein